MNYDLSILHMDTRIVTNAEAFTSGKFYRICDHK